MTEQQQRFNAGKPKHSYFFASKTAFDMLADECGTSCFEEARAYYAEALEDISAYLDDDDYALPGAAVALMQGLQVETTGEEVGHRGMHPAVFLAHVPAALDAYSAVCEYGEGKYARGNYRKGAPVTQYLDSALRHLLSRLRGERFDPESGKPHAGHALWNVIQAMEQPSFRDDRLPPVKQEPDPKPLPAWDQSDGVECATCHDDATLCPCAPCPEPETFDVVKAERRMRNGKTVEVIDGCDSLKGARVRFNSSGSLRGEFEFLTDKIDWRVSSFPYSYESCRFVEVV